MAKAKRIHKDVEFHVSDSSGSTVVFDTLEEAAGLAVVLSASTGCGKDVDVVIWSEAGARAYGGDDAVESYREDSEASVFERLHVKAFSGGRIA